MMIVEHTEVFQTWLTRILRPLCDADPAALAKYVLALIKKDKTEKELRQSMSDQLDVFLQSETKAFVGKLFEALKTKEYLNESMPSSTTEEKGEKQDQGSSQSSQATTLSSISSTELSSSDIQSLTPSSSSITSSSVMSSQNSTQTLSSTGSSSVIICSQSSSGTSLLCGLEGKKALNTLSITPSALLNSSDNNTSTSSSANSSQNDGKDDAKARRGDRRDDDRDKRRKRSRLDRRGSRSRSAERNKRSRSPRLRDRGDRMQHRARKSPLRRRYERDVWDRRRSRSPMRNRSASPRNRSRTPPRYRRPFNSSRSRSRSPLIRDRSRSRSPMSSQKDKKDSLLPLPFNDSLSDLSSSPEKPMVASVVVRPNAPQSDGTTAPGTGSKRCKDFDEKGLCMRGELCPFDHGQDPVVLEDVVVAGSGNSAYGSRGMVPGGPGYNAPLSRPGEYYPDNPSLEQPVVWGPGGPPPGFRPRHLAFDHVGRGRGGLLLRPPGIGPYPIPGPGRQLISVPVVGVPPVPVMGDLRGPHPSMGPMQMHPIRGLHGMRGRGRGGFDHGRLGAKPPRNYTNCSLEVRKIPREQNTIMELNSHFQKFGKIINIQITFENDPEAALVTFSSPVEAQLAYRSTEAVLNNRFIRVFWHNKEKENEEEADIPTSTGRLSVKDRLGGQQQTQQPQDQASERERIIMTGNTITKTVYNPTALQQKRSEAHEREKAQAINAVKRNQEMLTAQVNLKNLQEQKKQEALKMSNDLRKRQQMMMEEQIGQQKKLIAKIESGTLKPEEKEETLKLIKVLQESVTKLKKDLDDSNPTRLIKQAVVPPNRTREEAHKEMLDAELDLYNQEQQGGDTNDLQMKVMELRAQARSLGLIGIPRGRGYHRGGGGRGGYRGRGIMRGRGRGSVRALRSVDRRTTKVRIRGFPVERMEDLLSHFICFGPVRDYTTDPTVPEIIIDYDSRKCGEVAMANGQILPDLTLSVEWVNEMSVPENKPADTTNDTAHDDLDNSGSLLEDEEDDELGDILNSEILLTGEDDDDVDEDRSWRR